MKTRSAEVALALALAVAIGWPTLATVAQALRGGDAATAGAGGEGRPLRLAMETARLVLATEAIALPLGLPLALVLFRTDLWGRRAVLGLMAVSAFVPMPLLATAWLGALGNAGRASAFGTGPILSGWAGAAFVHAMASVPWIVLLAGVGLRAVEPELEEAALLDMPAWRVLTRVTLRRSVGALAAAALAVAVLTAGDMTVTDLLQVRTFAEEAYLRYSLGDDSGAAAVALPSLVVLGGLILLAARGLLRIDPAKLASKSARARTWRLGHWRVPLGLAVAATAGGLVLLPISSLVEWAGRVGGAAAIGQPPRWSVAGLLGTLRTSGVEAVGPLLVSVGWSALGASATVALAWPLAWFSRRSIPWQCAAIACAALTLATPGPVAGMGLVLAYRQVPWAYGSAFMMVHTDLLRTLPYALLLLWPSLRAIPPEYLDAAALDGHGEWGRIRRVALPLTRDATTAAWGVAFVLALGELPATNLVYPPGMMPLSVLIWSLLHSGVESHLAGVALVMLAVVAAAGLATAWALRRLEPPG